MKPPRTGTMLSTPVDGAERAAMPGDVGREVVAGAFRVAAGEDFGDVLGGRRASRWSVVE